MHSKPLARSNSRPTQHLGGRVRIPATVGAILAGFFALPGLANATSISMPFIFSNGTAADADDVNANFAVLVDESNDQDMRISNLESTSLVLGDLTAHEALPSIHDTYNAGTGMSLSATNEFSVDPTAVQTRVGGACAIGNAIRTVNQDGTVACIAVGGGGGGGAYFAGTGLLLGGAGNDTFSVQPDLVLDSLVSLQDSYIGNNPAMASLHIFHDDTSPLTGLTIQSQNSQGAPFIVQTQDQGRKFSIHYAGNNVFWVDKGGTVEVTGNVQAPNGIMVANAFNPLSDRRYKQDIQPLTQPLETVHQLRGVNYHWRRDAFPEKKFSADQQIGFIAQELETVLPALVHTNADGYKGVSYGHLTALLVEAVKELTTRMERADDEGAEGLAELLLRTEALVEKMALLRENNSELRLAHEHQQEAIQTQQEINLELQATDADQKEIIAELRATIEQQQQAIKQSQAQQQAQLEALEARLMTVERKPF